MIESPPKMTAEYLSDLHIADEDSLLIDKCNSQYLYWDKIKYQKIPSGTDANRFWFILKEIRLRNSQQIRIGNDSFFLFVTPEILRTLHTIDFGLGRILSVSDKEQGKFITSTLMEEAIASSNMEGASTTRNVAKKMLRSKSVPHTKGARMILNNYQTIRYLSDHRNDRLTPENLCSIHRMIAEGTLDCPEEAGRIRSDNNIFVMDTLSGDVIYTPQSASLLGEKIQNLCDFFNGTDDNEFIHPVLKAMIIHFYLAYLHPFSDGNGRTARSLFYWYMLKSGYSAIEFLSISRIIYARKSAYEKAFLYTEHDDNDITYFILNQCMVLDKAVVELQRYIEKKAREKAEVSKFIGRQGINERQALLLSRLSSLSVPYITVEEFRSMNGISTQTARTDLRHLAELGYLEEFRINERKSGFRIKRD